eukprot:2921209-Amphidinium_carterae.1
MWLAQRSGVDRSSCSQGAARVTEQSPTKTQPSTPAYTSRTLDGSVLLCRLYSVWGIREAAAVTDVGCSCFLTLFLLVGQNVGVNFIGASFTTPQPAVHVQSPAIRAPPGLAAPAPLVFSL